MTLLVAVLLTVCLMVGVRMASAPASAARVTYFAARHRLVRTPDGVLHIEAYLRRSRQARTVGVLCALGLGVAATLGQNRVHVEVLTLVAGWFVGAVVAEFRTPAGGEGTSGVDVPGWLLRVPIVLAVVAIAGTASAVALDRSDGFAWQIPAWGAAALACTAAIRVTVRHILGLPMPHLTPTTSPPYGPPRPTGSAP